MARCDLVTLKQVKILSRPEWWGSKFCFRVYSHGEGISTIYIGAYRRQRLADQVNKLYDQLVDLEVNRVPWLVRRKAASGTMFYLMDIKES